MTVYADIQSLESGAEVEGFIVDGTPIGAGILRFHGYTQVGSIFWKAQEYSPWPIQAEGFAFTSDKPPQPRLRVGNIDRSITTLCASFDDMVGAKVTRWRTLGKYLDAANFGGVNPTADPNEHWPDDIWFIERKAVEDNTMVEFELSSAMDFNGVQLPRRQIVASQCLWLTIGGYRGPYCGYAGGPVAKADDTATADPALDRCGGRVSSCKKRFGATGELNFGGFPAAGMVRL